MSGKRNKGRGGGGTIPQKKAGGGGGGGGNSLIKRTGGVFIIPFRGEKVVLMPLRFSPLRSTVEAS